jgi:uncharacterized membrane protein
MDNLSKGFIGLSAVGIPVALYHAYDEITNYSAPGTGICNLNHFFSCGSVFASGYTTFLGLSLWVYGVVWFPLMLILGLWFTRGGNPIRGEVLVPVLMIGNIFTIYLWYLELGVIHAICPVCVSLYALNYLMTVLAGAEALKD